MKSLLTILLSCLLSCSVWAAESIDINQASAEEMASALTGIGLSKAEMIVRYRDENGRFEHADELVNVKGIGLRTVDRNRDRIRVEGGAEPAGD